MIQYNGPNSQWFFFICSILYYEFNILIQVHWWFYESTHIILTDTPLITCRGASWLRGHQDFGETFSEWKLYESARAAYNLFSKRLENWDDIINEMGESCDYGNAKLVNSTVLQCMVACTQSILTAIWDGMVEEDLKMLVMETVRLCVACPAYKMYVMVPTQVKLYVVCFWFDLYKTDTCST